MTTLIAVYSNDGCVGRCDAKCYLATQPECDCICGGVNHGAGLIKAKANTAEMADAWAKGFAKRKGLADWEAMTALDLMQRELF